jgi:hypothetical protein
VLGLHGDGLNNSTAIVEETSTLTPTITGSVTNHTDSTAFGSSSLFFATGGKLTYPASSKWYLGNTFTIEAWLTPTAYPGSTNATRILLIGVNDTTSAFDMQLNYDGSLLFVVPYTPVTGIQTPANTVTLNARHHYALSVSNGVANIYKDGINVAGPVTITLPTSSSSNTLIIGYDTVNTVAGQYTGYIDDFRITKGIARYTSNFTVPTQSYTDYRDADYYWDNTVLLMHMEGANSSTSFTDEKGHTVSPGTQAVISTAKYAFGTSSAYFNGNVASRLTSPSSADWSFGTSDFTIETFFSVTVIPGANTTYRLINCGSSADGANNMWITFIAWNSSDQPFMGIQQWNGSTYVGNYTGAINISVGTWNHVAFVRSGTTISIYLNGSQIASGTSALNASVNGGSAGLIIGARYDTNNTTIIEPMNGYIDEARITKGVARYSGNYSVPAKAFPDFSKQDQYWNNTVLVMHGDGTNGATVFTDEKGGNITSYGTVVTSTTVYKFGTSSIYFPGASSRLSTDISPNYSFGSGNFTVEFWYTSVSKVSSYPLIIGNSKAWGSNAWGINDRHDAYPTKFTVFIYNALNGPLIVSNTTVTNNTTYHLALVRNGNTISLYVNGTLDSSATISVSLDSNSSDAIVIGNGYDGTQPVNSYVDDLRLTKGIARYTSNFNVPTAAFPNVGYSDPYFAYNTLLSHFDAFTDVMNHPLTANGSISVSSAVKKYGTASLLVGGLSQWVDVSNAVDIFSPNTSFTIEAWVNFTGDIQGDYFNLIGAGNQTYPSRWICDMGVTGGAFIARFATENNTLLFSSTSTPVALNTWNHIAYNNNVNSNTFSIFFNGTLVGTRASVTINSYSNIQIAKQSIYATALNSYYIDDLRVTKGAARYLGNFTPPTYSLPDQ